MNRLTDQQIQALLDDQRTNPQHLTYIDPADEEIQLYGRLFDELAKEPPNTVLSYAFSPKVIQQIQQQAIARSESKALVLYGLGLLIMLITMGAVLFLSDGNALQLLVQAFAKLTLPLLLSLIGVAVIQWVDYRLQNQATQVKNG